MRKIIYLPIIALVLTCFACKKDSTPTGPEQVTFWTYFSPCGNLSDIIISTNGVSASLNQFITNPPTCGEQNGLAVSYSLAPGTYGYSASSLNGNAYWTDNYTITSGSCQMIDISSATSSPQPGATTLMFRESQAGNTCTVNIYGSSGTITSYYPNITTSNPPTGGSAGCFSLALNSGSYAYTATNGTHNWSGTVNVTYPDCSGIRLGR